MARKKTAASKSSQKKQPVAAGLKKPAKSVATDKLSTTESTAQQITVRRTSIADPPEETTEATLPIADNLENPETDKAVDDIMAEESDIVLAVEDIQAEKRSQSTPESSWKDVFRSKWTWIGILVILGILFVLPATRYRLLGLVIKEKVDISVIDSQTKSPVSDALVSLAGATVRTDANGKAQLKAGVGERSLVITKQYYRTTGSNYFFGLKSNSPTTIKLVATGRLVPITVTNTISGKPLSNAVIHILNTTVRTSAGGQAQVALPTGAVSDNASISLAGYNTKQVSVQVTSLAVPGNSFTLTPSGTIYFLSNQSGTTDVVKSNLDGSGRQTVLAGSGHETANTTRLLASSDWHYLVLEADRSGSGAALYLIKAADNQVSEFDSSSATFNLIGWSGHNFVYNLTSTVKNQWQAGYEVVKDYNADQSALNQLDQNLAAGSALSYAYQNFSNFFIASGDLVYDTQWISQGGYDVVTYSDTIRAFQFDSQVLKDYESFPAPSTVSIAANRYQPEAIYFAVLSSSNNATSYYQYNNQNVASASINQTIFNQSSPSYLVSPSGNHAVWSERGVFSTSDSSAADHKQIASLGNYSPYGWYSDNYVLATGGNSQLYVLPASGLSGAQQPTAITAYYEPAAGSGYEYSGF
jgi:hypothetical protein